MPSETVTRIAEKLPPLVVLYAPRGFGKTTTVAHWLRGPAMVGRQVAWVSVEQHHTSGALWEALHDGLVLAGVTDDAEEPDLAAVQRAVGRLTERLVLVLDGLDGFEDGEVDSALASLAQDADMLDVIVTARRRRPVVDLGPLMVDTVVLSERELGLRPEQVVTLAREVGHRLTAEEAEHLIAGLAGWPALVRGVLLNAERDPEGRLQIDVAAVGRFAEIAVHDPGNLEWYRVMGALAIPERFSHADRRALLRPGWEQTKGEELLGTAFIVDHGDGHHGVAPILRTLVRNTVRVEQAERFRQLSETIARQRRAEYEAGTALAHAVDAEAWPLVLALIEENWAALLSAHLPELRAAIDALPTEVVSASARLTVARDYILDNTMVDSAADAIRSGLLVPDADLRVRPLTTSQRLVLRFDGHPTPGAADILLGRLDSLTGDGENVVPEYVARAVPELLTQWALAMLYDNNAVGAAYGFALACREASAHDDAVAAREAATGAGLMMALLGHLAAAEAWLERAPAFTDEVSALERLAAPLATRVIAALRLAEVDDEEEAPAGVDRGLTPLVELQRLMEAHHDMLHGRTDEATALLRRRGTDAFGTDRPVIMSMAIAISADLALVDGDLAKAVQLVAQAWDDGPFMRSARARQAFYVGAHRQVVSLTADALEYAGPRPRGGLELLLLRACALLRLAEHEAAADVLASAVAISLDSGVLLPFITVPRADLDAIAATDHTVQAFLASPALTRISCAFPEPLRADELSDAELRVLRELSAGATLAYIGRQLFIAESTVKTHVRRIYRKLGVTSRAAALARARELALLG